MATVSTDTTPTIFGSFEHVSVPALGITDTIAKIDTGAYSGALHCSDIRLIRKSDGEKVLRFTPSDNHNQPMEVATFTTKHVRSSSGHRVKRYVIEIEMVIHEKPYSMKIGLSNRSDMQREVLIGRRFLREHNILVDVRINQELDLEMEG